MKKKVFNTNTFRDLLNHHSWKSLQNGISYHTFQQKVLSSQLLEIQTRNIWDKE